VSVSFYFDHHVPVAVTDGLRQRGVDVLTTEEDGAATWSDERILERATEMDRAVYTQDRDFLVIAHDWQNTSREFSGVIYAHQTEITIGRAIDDLHLIAETCDPDDLRNRVEFIPL
jgi:Domain of unknown function (DUF5615)